MSTAPTLKEEMKRRPRNSQLYPHLWEILFNVAMDNGMFDFIRDVVIWPKLPPGTLARLELQASTMTPEEKELFVTGEMSEVEEAFRGRGLEELSNFAYEAFDGQYYDCFYWA